MKPFRSAAVFTALAVSIGCSTDLSEKFRVDVGLLDTPSPLALATAYQVGDTVDFLAVESLETDVGIFPSSQYGNSAQAPGLYSWQSNSPLILELVSPGRFRMLAVGEGSLKVQSPEAQTSVQIRVVPRIAAVRITPKNVTAANGDSIAFTVEPLDAAGAVIPSVRDLSSATVATARPTAGGTTILTAIGTRRTSPFPFRVTGTGDASVVASLSVYKRTALRDTAVVVVR